MCKLLSVLKRLLCEDEIRVRFTVGPIRKSTGVGGPPNRRVRKKGVPLMSLVITIDQEFDASVAFVDKNGNPATVDGSPSWGVSDPTILSVTPSADGTSAVVKALGPLGTCQLNVSGDADLGDGVTQVGGTLDVEVKAGQAVAATISAGAPRQQV